MEESNEPGGFFPVGGMRGEGGGVELVVRRSAEEADGEAAAVVLGELGEDGVARGARGIVVEVETGRAAGGDFDEPASIIASSEKPWKTWAAPQRSSNSQRAWKRASSRLLPAAMPLEPTESSSRFRGRSAVRFSSVE
jgi:hypothetical protein